MEPDTRKRNDFMDAWAVPDGYGAIAELADRGARFDVVSICSPTHSHAAGLEVALELMPKIVFCEKPVATQLSQVEKFAALYADAGIVLAVNYNRRWDARIRQLRQDMLAGTWGKLRSVSAVYNKGVLNNGSHMLDLLNFLVGPLQVVKVGEPINDFFPDDPTIPAWLIGPDGVSVHMACGHAEDYAIFELQLVFSGGVLTMEDGGLFWRERRVVESDVFKGYRVLDGGVRCAGGDGQSMCGAVDNIYRAIMRGDPMASTVESALVAQRLCEQIRNLAIA